MEDYIQQRIGKTLGERWRLDSVLGVGGMAAVYAAKDPAGQEVAVKVLHPEIGMRPEIRDRFMREGYAADRIQHPGVVRVLEHGAVDEWSVFLVMERLVGESLADRVTRHGTLPIPELLDILDQVLDVLAAAHDAGVVHRDLKPDNLFVLAGGRIKVLDFGLARMLDAAPDDARTRTGMAMGTMPYMAPEQALGKRAEIDGRVDLFALGATAFRILARRRIHETDSDAGMLVAMATQPAPALRSVAPQVDEPLAVIIDLALAFNRDARYPDARSMQADVRAVRRGEEPAFARATRQTRDEPTRIGAAAVVPGSAAFSGTHQSLAAPPGSGAAPSLAPASQGTPNSAAVTVVARLDAPTEVQARDVRHDAPTVVARLDAPTLAAPFHQPTAVGLGPAMPAATALPGGTQALPAAVPVPVAPEQPASGGGQPRRGRALGFGIAAVLFVAAGAGAAVWWVGRAPDPGPAFAADPTLAPEAVLVTTPALRPEAARASAPEAGSTPKAAFAARSVAPGQGRAQTAESGPSDEPAPLAGQVPASGAPETPESAAALVPRPEGKAAVDSSDTAQKTEAKPAEPVVAAPQKPPDPSATTPRQRDSHKPRGKSSPKGRFGKPDVGL